MQQYTLQAWAHTQKGREHDQNEDAFLSRPDEGLFVVCDGMGGKGLGARAADTAMKNLHVSLLASRAVQTAPREGAWRPEQRQAVLDALRASLEGANTAVYEETRSEWKLRGMGTTISVLLLKGRCAFIGHIGHGRIYLLRGKQLHLLTEDHTILAEIRKRKHSFDEETLKRMPYRNSLTRTLGPQPTVVPDLLEFELLPGDRFLLCTDGLHQAYEEEPTRLAELLNAGALGDAPGRLLAHSRSHDPSDDASAIIVEAMPESTATAGSLQKLFLHGMEGIRAVRLFQHLDDAELIRVLGISTECSFQTGDVIVQEGDTGDTMYLLLEGQVSVLVAGRQVTVLTPGSLFGEMALVTQQPRTATVRAESPIRAKVLQQQPLYEAMRENPTLANKILWNMVHVLSDRLNERSREMVRRASEG